MKANRLFIACVAALSLAACGGGTELNATLSGAAEKPTAVQTSATGSSKVTIDGGKLTVEGTFTGLSGNATAAHIHGPADENSVAGVFCNLSVQAATSGTITAGSGENSCASKTLTDA
jgi:CHRD domain